MLKSFLSLLVSNNLIELSWQLFFWTILGSVAGIVSGVLAFWLIRSWGGYRSEAKGATWWRAVVCALNVFALLAVGAYIGMFEGLYRGIQAVAQRSSLIMELNAKTGKVEAVFAAGLYHAALLAEQDPAPAEVAKAVGERLDTFVSGREEIPVQGFLQRMDTVGPQVVMQVIGVVEQKTLAWIPAMRGILGQRLLREGLEALGDGVLNEKAREGLRRARLDVHLERALSAMPAAAARDGSPEMLSFAELSWAFEREGIMPWILDAVRGIVRTHQAMAMLLAAGALLLPVLGFWIARALRTPQMGSLDT